MVSDLRSGEVNPGFKSLIVIQRVERCKMLLKNLVRVYGRRSADEVEDLHCNILRKASHGVVKLSL